MCNLLCKYVIENNVLYSKPFGFQNGHYTGHAVVQLVDQITESFENDNYTLGVFIDLSKAFDTVDHSFFLKNLVQRTKFMDGSKASSQIGEKSFKSVKTKKTSFETIRCGVPQGSILRPFLSLLYVNDLKTSSNILDPIMFADDTNYLFTH